MEVQYYEYALDMILDLENNAGKKKNLKKKQRNRIK
jgi:hypothetical protein